MSNNPCVWCLVEQGWQLPEGVSSGICERHADMMTGEMRDRQRVKRLRANIAAYVSQPETLGRIVAHNQLWREAEQMREREQRRYVRSTIRIAAVCLGIAIVTAAAAALCLRP